VLKLLLSSCSSSGKAVLFLVMAIQQCKSSLFQVQLSFSSGAAQSIRQGVDIELMKSELLALMETMVLIKVINTLPLLHRVCEK